MKAKAGNQFRRNLFTIFEDREVGQSQARHILSGLVRNRHIEHNQVRVNPDHVVVLLRTEKCWETQSGNDERRQRYYFPMSSLPGSLGQESHLGG